MAVYEAAVRGAAPAPLVAAALRAAAEPAAPTHLFALGKAAPAMADAAVAALSPSSIVGGVVVALEVGPVPHPAVVAVRGDHPRPDAASWAAARLLGARASAVGAGHRALVLLSGGATSLVAAPAPGFAEQDLGRLFDLLQRSGLDIRAMNVVRRRFTQWGGGRLALALAPARVDVLVISDVPGDDPSDVASGPCAPDGATAADVRQILDAANLSARVPAAMRAHLDAVVRGDAAETPKAGHPAFRRVATRVIGSNRLAVDAAVACARRLGHGAEACATTLDGDAARCGATLAEVLLARAQAGWRGCLVWGGETTVERAEPGPSGATPALGGRCQELALAAARRLAAGGPAAERVALLAAGTDGRDGPTDAAGAFADAAVWDAVARAGHDPERALAHHASYAALDAAGALHRRGATGTNVMDVVIGLVG